MKKHQHFIPKSYLKNFAVETSKDTFMVEAKYRSEAVPKKNLISIVDICVSKNLYTIPTDDLTKRYALEDYYAKNVDGVYPEVYKWLTDPNIKYLSADQKVKVLMTIMSMYFRTPKFLDFHEDRFNQALDTASTTQVDSRGIVHFTFDQKVFEFDLKDLEIIRREHQLENKKKFLHSHLEAWHNFTKVKLDAHIAVSNIYEDVELITSDNPVVIRRFKQSFTSVFDPENIIEVPLDNKHYLTIYPNSEKIGTSDLVSRSSWDKLHAIKVNYGIEEFSVDWLLGKPGTVQKHIADQEKYGAFSEENQTTVKAVLQKAEDMKEILRLAKLGINQNFARKVKELKNKEDWKGTPHLRDLLETCAQHGLSVE